MSTNPKPLISVIVASYDHSRFLDERIQSLLCQTYTNLEVIIIDDNSTDESVSIINKYLTDSRVKLIKNPKNRGWINVSNQGFDESTGDYLLFANCDDSCAPTLIEELLNQFNSSSKIGLAYSRSLIIDEFGEILSDDFAGREEKFRKFCSSNVVIDGKLMARFLMRSCVIPNLSAALISKVAFEKSGGFSHKYEICSDWDFYIRLSEQFAVGYISLPLNNFRKHSNSIRSTAGVVKLNKEILELLLEKSRMQSSSFLARIQRRFNAMSLLSEWIINRKFVRPIEILEYLKFTFILDFKSLYLLPFSLNWRIYKILGHRISRLKLKSPN
jgi:glycosyltransferase involved in cell wall biosynthesis